MWFHRLFLIFPLSGPGIVKTIYCCTYSKDPNQVTSKSVCFKLIVYCILYSPFRRPSFNCVSRNTWSCPSTNEHYQQEVSPMQVDRANAHPSTPFNASITSRPNSESELQILYFDLYTCCAILCFSAYVMFHGFLLFASFISCVRSKIVSLQVLC